MRLRPDTLQTYHHYCHSSIYVKTTDLIDHGLHKGKLGDDDRYLQKLFTDPLILSMYLCMCVCIICMIPVTLYPYIVRIWTNVLVLRRRGAVYPKIMQMTRWGG